MTRDFEGVEPCPICYCVISSANGALPKMGCRQCTNRYHASCLFQYFSSSNKSVCPVCQTVWGTTTR